jgi:hypothetical protein
MCSMDPLMRRPITLCLRAFSRCPARKREQSRVCVISASCSFESSLADHVWSVEELIALLPEQQAKKRGSYRPRQK